jgi:hypothetical protein
VKVLLAIAMLAGGCISTSQVGPFVKHVQRNGDWLVVHKCMIVLEGDEIREQACTAEQVPLRSLPSVPQPQVQPQPPVQPAPPPRATMR